MYFRSLLVVLVAPLLALAQQANPFNIPPQGLSASAGKPLTLKWNPTTQGTVTLVLRSGSSNDLNKGTVIAPSIANSGSYTWTPSNSITRGSDYAIEIVDDSDPSQTNYTPYFIIDSDNTVASATPTVTLGASGQTSITSQTGVQTSATSTSSDSSASSESMSSSSGMTNTMTNGGMTTQTTGGTSPTNGGSSSATGASFQPTGQSATAATGAAPRATAAAGMLGLVALGALAL